MKHLFQFVLSSLFIGFNAVAVPPAGTPELGETLLETQLYKDVLAALDPIASPKVEASDHYGAEMPDLLTSGTCESSVLSRSGTLVKVSVPVRDGIKIVFFGSPSGMAEDAVLCEVFELKLLFGDQKIEKK